MKIPVRLMLAFSIACAAAAACYTGPELEDPYAPLAAAPGTTSVDGTFDCSSGVADVLSSCQTCHSSPPTGGASNSLMTRAQLMARSASDPSKTVAQVSLARMQDAKNPMPPTGVASAADVAKLDAWIKAGMPGGDCGGGTNVFAGGSVCTSGKTHTGEENANMRPGEACNNCHRQKRKRIFTIAGTVYPTGHEPNDCVGVTDSSVKVVVTDGTGKETTIPVGTRNNGNFTLEGATFAKPVHVRVESADGSKKRAMATELNLAGGDGDCNGCHTEGGANKAPGRIAAP